MKNKTLFVVVAGLIAAALIGLFIVSMVVAVQPGNRPTVGSPAPDFNVTLYSKYQADYPQSIKLSDLRGKVVIVNFWASWCVECRKESDALESVWRQYRDRGLVVLGIDYLDTETSAYEYLKQYGTSYLIGADLQENISRAYHITGVPETFFIDRKGNISKTVTLAMTQQELVSTVEQLVNQQ